jgi:hypothetical protein
VARIEHRHRGFVGEQFLPLPELHEQVFVQPTQVPGGVTGSSPASVERFSSVPWQA